MSVDVFRSAQIQPILGSDGKPVPGYFAFDVLPRDPQIEKNIATYLSEEDLKEKIKKIEEPHQ